MAPESNNTPSIPPRTGDQPAVGGNVERERRSDPKSRSTHSDARLPYVSELDEQRDPQLVATDILLREGPQVQRGHNGRSFVTQIEAMTLAQAYLDLLAEVGQTSPKSAGASGK